MIQRKDSRPDTLGTCTEKDAVDAVELETRIDDAIRKHEADNPPSSTLSIDVSRVSLRALDAVVRKYRDAGWGVLVVDHHNGFVSHIRLHIQW